MKYLESLVDVSRFSARKKTAASAENAPVKVEGGVVVAVDVGVSINMHHEEKYMLDILKTHMSNTILWSAYNWIRPSLWSTMFTEIDIDWE